MPLPPAIQVLKQVEPLTTLLYSSFGTAIPAAQTFFATRGRVVDANLFPHLVRYELKELLGNAGQIVQDEEVFDYARDDIANNGLCLTYGQYQMRILKAVDGQLPLPGRSVARRLYYAQQLTLGLNGAGRAVRSTTLNLVLLWDVDDRFDLHELRLSCPKAAGDTRDSIEEYWSEVVPAPGHAVRQEEPEVLEDLPLERLDDEAADEGDRAQGS